MQATAPLSRRGFAAPLREAERVAHLLRAGAEKIVIEADNDFAVGEVDVRFNDASERHRHGGIAPHGANRINDVQSRVRQIGQERFELTLQRGRRGAADHNAQPASARVSPACAQIGELFQTPPRSMARRYGSVAARARGHKGQTPPTA